MSKVIKKKTKSKTKQICNKCKKDICVECRYKNSPLCDNCEANRCDECLGMGKIEKTSLPKE